MPYIDIIISNLSYHGAGPLTYSSAQMLQKGEIVRVPLRDGEVLGIVAGPARQKPRQKLKPIAEVLSLPPLPTHILALLEWLHEYYPSPLAAAAQLFLPKNLPTHSTTMPEISIESVPTAALPPLTNDQKAALQHFQPEGLHILHGTTGSGKTRIYIELTQKALAKGRSAIILTPEIGLTPQLADAFRAVFGERVFVVHSQQTEAARRQLWLQLLHQKEPVILVGPRSALFMPIRRPGLIVVDECHENAYKQEQAPHYHAVRVASKLAALVHAPIVLGSATPSVTDYFIAGQKHRPIIRMKQRAASLGGSSEQRDIIVADLRDRSFFRKSPHLSDQLIKAMQEALARKEQILLFLNRRGTARLILCDICGWQALCPHCDIALTYHGDTHTVRCHSCGFHAEPPIKCGVCDNPSVLFRCAGTKAIAEEAVRLFPHATINRYDNDNKKAERIEQNYGSVRQGATDILIGTQILAKGFDLPRLAVVGVINADSGLAFPDFSAQERTYQLLSQVIGRVGRGHRPGQCVIQTYVPDSKLLQDVIGQDWQTFYQAELEERRQFHFPPFCHVLKLSVRRASRQAAQTSANKLQATLQSSLPSLQVEGPSPSFRERVQGKFQWQLVVKAHRRSELLEVIHSLPAGWSYDIDPLHLL